MRFQELVLRIPGEELRVRFHEQLTVLSGIGILERQALSDALVGALTGDTDDASLTYVDWTGRTVRLVATGGRVTGTHLEDGSPAPVPLGRLFPDAQSLRLLMCVQAVDLGLTPRTASADEPPDLLDARRSLEELTAELEAAATTVDAAERVRAELASVEAGIARADDDVARREYAKVLASLEDVRAEAAAVQTGHAGVEADRHLLAAAADVHAIAGRWADASERASELSAAFGARSRLTPDAVGAARSVPDAVPADLDQLVDACTRTRRERDELTERLRALAASRLPTPSSPLVAELARADQVQLWNAHHDVLDARRQLDEAKVALGGLETEVETPAVVAEIEAAHKVVEEAERRVNQRFVPGVASSAIGAVLSLAAAVELPAVALPALVASVVAAAILLGWPRHLLAGARRAESAQLARADASTYLAFHLRRVEAAVDPAVRVRLETATAAQRHAAAAWRTLAGDVDPAIAAPLEDEVRAYAGALADLGGAADEIEALRVALDGDVAPAAERAEAALVEVYERYGVAGSATADPDRLPATITARVADGATARLQEQLEAAEATLREIAADLDRSLHQLGFGDGTLEARAAAFDWATGRAADREAARSRARSRDEIEEDLVRLQGEARRLRRPEWDAVQPADAEGPDVAALVRRRDELTTELSRLGEIPDVEQLADRQRALERRVAALEARVPDGGLSTSALSELQQRVLVHLTNAGHVGPMGEPMPVVLDEPFLRVPAERKWELMDMLRRLGDKTQLIYLTEDPFVASWARRRAAAGMITLLEPAEV